LQAVLRPLLQGALALLRLRRPDPADSGEAPPEASRLDWKREAV
jgi:hypothetical protein